MWMLEGWICCKRSALKRGSTVLNDLKLHTFSIVCPSISHPLVLTSLLSCLFTCYLPFPHLLNHLSTPGMEAILLPVDVRTSNSWGDLFLTAPAAEWELGSLQGGERKVLSEKPGLPSINTPVETTTVSHALCGLIRSPDTPRQWVLCCGRGHIRVCMWSPTLHLLHIYPSLAITLS